MLLHTVYHTKIYIVNIRKKESFEKIYFFSYIFS